MRTILFAGLLVSACSQATAPTRDPRSDDTARRVSALESRVGKIEAGERNAAQIEVDTAVARAKRQEARPTAAQQQARADLLSHIDRAETTRRIESLERRDTR